MTDAARAVQAWLYVLVLVLAAGWVAGFVVSLGGPGDEVRLADHVIVVLVVALPWLFAVRLLWRAWWRRHGRDVTALDPPARLLATAVATLPRERRDWGAAMVAELAEVRDPADRWRFAAGCAQVALAPAHRDRGPVIAVAAWAAAAVVTAAVVVGEVRPELQVFAVVFTGVLGTLAVVAVLRAPRVGFTATGLSVALTGLTGVAACVAATAWFLDRFPIATTHLSAPTAGLLAVALAGILWLVLAPPRVLTAGGALPRVVAVVVAAGLGAGLLLWSRLALREVGELDAGIFPYLYVWAPVVVLAGSAVAGAIRRSLRAGVQAAVWTALLGVLALFAVGVTESVGWYEYDTSLILAGDGIPLAAVGENLRNLVWSLLLLPFWWVPFGVLGAAAGASVGRRIAA